MELFDEMPAHALDKGLIPNDRRALFFRIVNDREMGVPPRFPSVAQIIAAFRRRNDHEVIITWAEHLAYRLQHSEIVERRVPMLPYFLGFRGQKSHPAETLSLGH